MRQSTLSHVFSILVKLITSTKYFFKPEFKTKRYNLHFYFSIIIVFLLILILRNFTSFVDTGLFFNLFAGFGFGFAINFFREGYLSIKNRDIKSDMTDVIFGAYGGFTGTIIYLVLSYVI